MDQRLESIIAALLRNIDTLNHEIQRLSRSEQFTPTAQCFQMIEQIRGSCMCSLQNLRTVERRLYLRLPASEEKPSTKILPLDFNS